MHCKSKKRYPTYEAAATAASGAMMRKLNAPEFVRVYQCPECKGYHLTSKPFDTTKAG